jgi:hypothetical protein
MRRQFGMAPFPMQYGYRVSGVDIYFVKALQLLASLPIVEKVEPLSAQNLTRSYIQNKCYG